MIRILFMGTPEFAALSLEALLEAQFEVIGVVTQPDRPKGRGLELKPSEVKVLALNRNLPVWQPEEVSAPEFLQVFTGLKPDLVVVVAFGQKIPPEILFGPRLGCVNVHGSLLPQYRGAAPIHRSILNGDTVTGITTMYMDEGWDTGDIIYQEATPIDPEENFGSLYLRLGKIGGELLVKTIKDLESGVAPRIKQNEALATKAFKLKPELQTIDWKNPGRFIHNQVRVLAPAPGVGTTLNEERLKIIRTKIYDSPISSEKTASPGEIIEIIKNQGILTATSTEPLLLVEVQPLGKKVMGALEFANGRRLKAGMRFL
ncbi:MAG TPA: methionyl-tRNA formyltransferase [Bacillota bacterium]|nr:methionyl-tRNA formyltransferase [Bacillota bacterium]